MAGAKRCLLDLALQQALPDPDQQAVDRNALRQEMSRVDAGIDTSVETECDGCGTKIRTRLEAEPAFLFPGVRL